MYFYGNYFVMVKIYNLIYKNDFIDFIKVKLNTIMKNNYI